MIIDHNHADNNNSSTPMKVLPTIICAEVTQLVSTKLCFQSTEYTDAQFHPCACQ